MADNSTLSPQSANSVPVISLSRRVVTGVVDSLESGRLVAGQRLVEADLCLRFGVSRNVVREALQRLESQGVVEISRHKGAIIREYSTAQAIQTMEVVELLAGLSARAAARGIDEPGAAAMMRDALDRLAQAEELDALQPFLKARSAFYAALLRIGRHHELQRMLPALHIHVLRAQFDFTALHRRSHDDYRTIGAAVLAGDEAAAERAAKIHAGRVRAALEARAAEEDLKP